MEKKKKILFYSEGWGTGGIESFIMNAVRVLDPAEYSFEIFCTHDYDDSYDDEIRARGGIRHVVFKDHKPNLVKRTICGADAWGQLLTRKSFDVVHVNTMNGVGFLYAWLAKRHGVPVRIVHSHNTAFGGGSKVVKTLAHEGGRLLFGQSATDLIACSAAAGRYLFRKDTFSVIPNAIDIRRFLYHESARREMRERLGIPQDAFVVGYVGRLEASKNPLRALEVFSHLATTEIGAYMIFIGQGVLEDDVSSWLSSFKGASMVKRIKSTNDMPGCLSAMDVLCAPSRFEGNPIVLLEAQANGLPAVTSNSVSDDVNLTNLIRFEPLCADSVLWAESLLKARTREESRGSYGVIMERCGYGFDHLAQSLAAVYSQEIQN